MKNHLVCVACIVLGVSMFAFAGVAKAQRGGEPVRIERDISFRNELQNAIERGLQFLQANQNSNGYWSNPEQPALTALPLMAFKGEPSGKYKKSEPAWLKKGYSYLLSHVKPDGGIYKSNLITYSTSLSLMALLVAEKPEYDPVILKARRFLIGLQGDFGEKGKIDNVYDGGIGYGSRYEHSDMGNTLAALEAIYYSKQLATDKGSVDKTELNFEAAIHFLQNCQNLSAYNNENWVSDDPKNKGGFIYYPGNSMAGAETNASGRVALRSYGSISYGGMLSYIYADLKRDDPRVTAVATWLKNNYTVEENPGMGPQGLFFYLHTMTRALSLYGIDQMELAGGKKADWRKEAAMKLLNLQQKDGSWLNENGRWMERDPALVTAYAVMTLERIYRGL